MDKKRYFPEIDALRFAAALIVMLYHLAFFSWAGSVSQGLPPLPGAAIFGALIPISWFGWVGVEIFFVISGMVIANSMQRESAWLFLKSRMLRLYPAAWICASITFIVQCYRQPGHMPTWRVISAYLHSLVLLPNHDGWISWIDSVYWTLGVEIGFYAIALVSLLVPKALSLTRIAWSLTAGSSIYMAIVFLHYLGVSQTGHLNAFFDKHIYLVYNLFQLRYGATFAVGIWLSLAANKQMTMARWFALAAAAFVTCMEVYLRSKDFILSIPPISKESSVAPVLAILIGMAIVFISAIRSSNLQNARKYKVNLRALGLLTYPLYLVHAVVGTFICRTLVLASVNKWMALVISIGFVITLAWTISRFIEPRVRTFFSGALDRIDLSASGHRVDVKTDSAP